MTSEEVLLEARKYSERIANQMGQPNVDDMRCAAFLAYLQGFKHGLDHERQTIAKLTQEIPA